MLEVRTGNPLSTRSAEAARLYQQGVDLMLGSESGAAQALDRALELDNDFALAAAARYCVARDVGETDADIYRERALQSALHATEWERAHTDILIGLIDQPGVYRENALAYIETAPADLLIVSQLAGYLFFYGGSDKLEAVLHLFESVQHALSDDWAFLARFGFAASEAGQYQRGRELLERALRLRPQALYTIHALAHLLHDEGKAEESARVLRDWLSVYEAGARQGQMYGHVQWHLALSEWQLGEQDAAMQRYNTYCAPGSTTCGPILTLADCGGFLLREYLQSGQAHPLEDDVLRHIERVQGMMGHPFVALHVAGLYASAGDLTGLTRCENRLKALPPDNNRTISLALVSALYDFVAADYSQAARTLAAISPAQRVGIGGSNVERILIDLIEAGCTAKP